MRKNTTEDIAPTNTGRAPDSQTVDILRERCRKLVDSEPIRLLAAAFAQAGYELSLVGGPIRDCLLGRPVEDLDLTTNARPDDILRIVKPLASAHWDVGRAFGTVGARIKGRPVEITTYRSDRYRPDSRKPQVSFGDTLEGDLIRRDFTINSLALRLPAPSEPSVSPETPLLIDPSGGLRDLLDGCLRTPVAPEISFADDPLRILRAARFAAQLGFAPEPTTLAAMAEQAERLQIVSAERIRNELEKLLSAPEPLPGVRLLVECGLAEYFLPELPALQLEVDEHFRHKDVYEHSLTVLENAIRLEKLRHPGEPPDLVLRLAALLHDIGKPATRRIDNRGAVTFYHHDVVGAKLATRRLQKLRFDKQTVLAVARLIELHLRFFGYADRSWSDSAVRRYARDAADQLERLHILTRADVTTRNRRKADRLRLAYNDLETRIAQLAEDEELAAIRPELDGNAIMQTLGIGPGREVGEAYRFLLNLRLDKGILGEDEARRHLQAWWERR